MPLGSGGGGTPFTGGTIAGPLTIDDGSSQRVVLESTGFSLQDAGTLDGIAAVAPGQMSFSYIAAPPDGGVPISSFSLWLDATPGVGNTKLMVKARDSGGTIRTAAIALA